MNYCVSQERSGIIAKKCRLTADFPTPELDFDGVG